MSAFQDRLREEMAKPATVSIGPVETGLPDYLIAFKEGDLVRLRSGSPALTVTQIDVQFPFWVVNVKWFNSQGDVKWLRLPDKCFEAYDPCKA